MPVGLSMRSEVILFIRQGLGAAVRRRVAKNVGIRAPTRPTSFFVSNMKSVRFLSASCGSAHCDHASVDLAYAISARAYCLHPAVTGTVLANSGLRGVNGCARLTRPDNFASATLELGAQRGRQNGDFYGSVITSARRRDR